MLINDLFLFECSCDVDADQSSDQSIECVTRMTLDKHQGWRNVVVRVKSIKLAVCLSELTIQGETLPVFELCVETGTKLRFLDVPVIINNYFSSHQFNNGLRFGLEVSELVLMVLPMVLPHPGLTMEQRMEMIYSQPLRVYSQSLQHQILLGLVEMNLKENIGSLNFLIKVASDMTVRN